MSGSTVPSMGVSSEQFKIMLADTAAKYRKPDGGPALREVYETLCKVIPQQSATALVERLRAEVRREGA